MSAPPGVERGGVSLPSLLLQICLILLSFLLWQEPFIQPLKLLVVLLHEMSHGLMALATGGTVHEIRITPQEGGACRSEGGNGILVASAGYLGSMFFGGMILRAARGGSSVPVCYALLALLVLGAAVTVLHDPYSRTFALALAGSFIFLGLVAPAFVGALFMRAIGTVSCLYAIFDIYADLLAPGAGQGEMENDAQAFAALTGVPEGAVGFLWLAISLLFFVAVLRSSLEAPARASPALPSPLPRRPSPAGA
jgi:hypothetical protein